MRERCVYRRRSIKRAEKVHTIADTKKRSLRGSLFDCAIRVKAVRACGRLRRTGACRSARSVCGMGNSMGREKEENEKIAGQSGETMVIFLQNWKKKVRRLKIYRALLVLLLIVSTVALAGVTCYYIDSSIPSVINVRAGEEESFRLGIWAKAEIQSVSEGGKSNIPEGAVDIDLSRTVTMKLDGETAYRMQVKLFGFLPVKQIGIRVIEDQELIPVGAPIGIYIETDGVLVVGTGEFQGENGKSCSPGKNIVKSGDYIREVNGIAVDKKDEVIKLVEECGGEAVALCIERDGALTDVTVQPEKNADGAYKIGVWVRDNTQGVGTMTYIDSEGNFGALGHGINDVDTGTLLQLDDGTLYETSIIDIRKGSIGKPGEMTGMIVYSDSHILGSITTNSVQGIFGSCNNKALSLGTGKALPIGLKQELNRGAAQILCTVDGNTRYYDIEITDIHLDHDNVNRGIELKVTDPALLELTGGIVQGMSGSPIIQDGKIVGAVTHVLVNDPTRGYGIFIENMLEH